MNRVIGRNLRYLTDIKSDTGIRVTAILTDDSKMVDLDGTGPLVGLAVSRSDEGTIYGVGAYVRDGRMVTIKRPAVRFLTLKVPTGVRIVLHAYNYESVEKFSASSGMPFSRLLEVDQFRFRNAALVMGVSRNVFYTFDMTREKASSLRDLGATLLCWKGCKHCDVRSEEGKFPVWSGFLRQRAKPAAPRGEVGGATAVGFYTRQAMASWARKFVPGGKLIIGGSELESMNDYKGLRATHVSDRLGDERVPRFKGELVRGDFTAIEVPKGTTLISTFAISNGHNYRYIGLETQFEQLRRKYDHYVMLYPSFSMVEGYTLDTTTRPSGNMVGKVVYAPPGYGKTTWIKRNSLVAFDTDDYGRDGKPLLAHQIAYCIAYVKNGGLLVTNRHGLLDKFDKRDVFFVYNRATWGSRRFEPHYVDWIGDIEKAAKRFRVFSDFPYVIGRSRYSLAQFERRSVLRTGDVKMSRYRDLVVDPSFFLRRGAYVYRLGFFCRTMTRDAKLSHDMALANVDLQQWYVVTDVPLFEDHVQTMESTPTDSTRIVSTAIRMTTDVRIDEWYNWRYEVIKDLKVTPFGGLIDGIKRGERRSSIIVSYEKKSYELSVAGHMIGLILSTALRPLHFKDYLEQIEGNITADKQRLEGRILSEGQTPVTYRILWHNLMEWWLGAVCAERIAAFIGLPIDVGIVDFVISGIISLFRRFPSKLLEPSAEALGADGRRR